MDNTPESISRDFHRNGGDPLTKDYMVEDDPDAALHKIKTSGTGSVTISSDLFEKLYLQPKMEAIPSRHPLQRILGNPTALGIVGFEMSLMPITMQLCEWRVSGGRIASENTACIFYGGVLMWITGLFEFLLGNSFPFIVFMTFGSFYTALGTQGMPDFAAYAAWATDPNDLSTGASQPGYLSSWGLYWVAFTVLMFVFWILTFRTNVVFVLLFTCIVPGCGCLAGVYLNLGSGNADTAHDCQLAAGGILFAATCIGWYLLAGLMFPMVDFPIPVPLGDLSRIVPGLSEIMEGAGGGRNPTRKLGLFRKGRKDSVVAEDAV